MKKSKKNKKKKFEKSLNLKQISKLLKKINKTVKINKILMSIAIFLSALLVIFLLVGFGIYFLNWNNFVTVYASKAVPYPAVIIGKTKTITYKDYRQNVELIRRYHNLNSVMTSFEEFDLAKDKGVKFFKVAQKNTLQNMIENQIIEDLAQKYNVTVTQDQIQEQSEKIANLNGGKRKLDEKIEQTYNIETDYFEQNILKNALYKKNLKEFLIQSKIIKDDQSSDENEKQTTQTEVDFDQWLNEQIKNYKIIVLLDNYYWDKENSTLRFSDSDMEKFETQVIKNNSDS
ncbi:MAG: hypothetical protein GF335_03290 [Candidatus Moranbacteria bacterium]|nr:hypothetical protein [Candidatus Moranbacteria bacterium]